MVAAHLPITHKPTPAESDQHKATKERIVQAAVQFGLSADAEVGLPSRRGVTDAMVTGPAGVRIGWEIQYSPLSPSSVHRRSVIAMEHDITPLWVAKDDRAALIDRAPWARVDDMSWKRIADGSEMIIRGGYRHLQVWRCLSSSALHCPDTEGQAIAARFTPSGFFPRSAIRPSLPSGSRTSFSPVRPGTACRSSCRAGVVAGWVATCGFPAPTAGPGGS
ncbi:hypothetical protein NKH18_27365 [Streptomyces sp. M10(2022)]